MGKPAHILFRRRDGSIRLILPTANRRVLRSVLNMYFPSRLLGKVYRLAQQIVMPVQTRLGWCESAGDVAAWGKGLEQALALVPSARPEYVGALISEPGPRSKLTLKIMDEAGQALAYGRVGYTPMAMEVIRHETTVLKVLANMPVASQVPQLLGAADLVGHMGCYMMESAGPDLEAGHELTYAHFQFLSGLKTGMTKKWTAVVEQLDNDVAPLFKIQGLSATVDNAMQFLKSLDLPDVPVVIEHGDFAPWNIRCSQDGGLFILDWEHSRRDGLPWMDALHFVFRYLWLVRRQSHESIRNELVMTIRSGQRSYPTWDATLVKSDSAFIIIFFLRLLVSNRYEREEIISMILITPTLFTPK